MRQLSGLRDTVTTWDNLSRRVQDGLELLALASEEGDEDTAEAVANDAETLATELERLEFQIALSGPHDRDGAILAIHAGAGGTEAQDWAEMLLRMYLKWSESNGFTHELIEASAGEVAGIKSATIHVKGENAFGWLRTETGVHRLVRKSPFDSGNRRHTSFAAVFVSPEVDDDIDILGRQIQCGQCIFKFQYFKSTFFFRAFRYHELLQAGID